MTSQKKQCHSSISLMHETSNKDIINKIKLREIKEAKNTVLAKHVPLKRGYLKLYNKQDYNLNTKRLHASHNQMNSNTT